MAAIIYNNNTKKFSVLEDEFQKHFSEVRTFAKKFSKETAEKKVEELKKEQSQEKDPKKKASLAKRIAKWSAIAAGVAGASYLSREIGAGAIKGQMKNFKKEIENQLDKNSDDYKKFKDKYDNYMNTIDDQPLKSDLIRDKVENLFN